MKPTKEARAIHAAIISAQVGNREDFGESVVLVEMRDTYDKELHKIARRAAIEALKKNGLKITNP